MSPKEVAKDLFKQFEPELQKKLQQVGQVRKFKEDEYLMYTGQPIRSAVLVVDGIIKVFREDDEGNEIFMYNLHPGEACAISMTCAAKNLNSQVMAKALVDTTVIAIPMELMDEWASKYKSWYQFVLGTYRNRFEELLEMLDQIAFKNLDERLLWYLRQHQKSLHSNVLKIPFTQIALELNSSREVISRLMKKLADKGQVKLHKNQIEIIQLPI
ncbi:Crp/Fnr family transcriptional regulator [Sandaracinomonas limnophila]|uniref:Crp/Fnr family transcriptional regulator n=1 Tax=Sandaracinomonas limnophila TaxID=1862386 RepID=A0A437PXN9_9BACT|nr:Crp/Fnr family transcriptional regulator [Sandaracinomonas limnophila]RVU27009.1 Crp/Fnr family transcriptional regulator [Sandaracinomonas limnophila]